MKTIIVDDEPKAIELLKSYLSHFNQFELVSVFRNGLKAIEYLSHQQVDLVFLDINMPHISGLSVARMIPNKTKIIFTTAYSEFAVESYDVEAIDYLLKPITLERFTKAVTKLLVSNGSTDSTVPQAISIKSGNRIHRIKPEDIRFLQKDGNYMTYHLADRKILARQTVGEALDVLPTQFVQAHKSYIVNLDQITSFNHESIYISDSIIPVGASYRNAISGKLEY